MAGLQRRQAFFDGPRPSLAQLLERAEALGAMALYADYHSVAFVEFPEVNVTVHFPDEPTECVSLVDNMGESSAVMHLLEHALVAMGGRIDPAPIPLPLPLPLTIEFLRRDRRRKM